MFHCLTCNSEHCHANTMRDSLETSVRLIDKLATLSNNIHTVSHSFRASVLISTVAVDYCTLSLLIATNGDQEQKENSDYL